MIKAKIKEIFSSVQGEGPYIGYKQLFIRFCGCNLKCRYCDTDYDIKNDYTEYDATTLLDEINKYPNVHSISLTGGEPLASNDFLKEFLPMTDKKIYLETNATLYDAILELKPYIDIISADIKLESATGLNTKNLHEKFFQNCKGVETFAKIVFNNNITEDEINYCTELGKKFDIELILQPEMMNKKPSVTSEFAQNILDKFLKKYRKTRLIPQVHKFMNIR